jgi:putative transposase
LLQRADTVNIAFFANPKRFKGKIPQPPRLPTAAWINQPTQEIAANTTLDPSTLNKCILVSQSH